MATHPRGFALVLVPVYFIKHSVLCYIYYIQYDEYTSVIFSLFTHVYALTCSTDCVFSPTEQVIMTGTSVKKGQVRTDVCGPLTKGDRLPTFENTNSILALLRLFCNIVDDFFGRLYARPHVH